MKATPDFNDIHLVNGGERARQAFDDGVAKAAKKKRLVRSLTDFLADFEPPDYLVDGLLQRRFLYSLTGATGSGKTAIATLLSVLVGHPELRAERRLKFGPHAVEKGRVVYIAADNKTDVQMRFIALCAKLQVDADKLDILVIDDIKDLAKQYPTIEAEMRAFGPADLVIVDTAPALFPGDDENSNVQTGRYTRDIRELAELPGRPCVLALYHPIKRPTSADDLLPRGGGATIAEVDGNFSLWAIDEGCPSSIGAASFAAPALSLSCFGWRSRSTRRRWSTRKGAPCRPSSLFMRPRPMPRRTSRKRSSRNAACSP
jgi:AAA domain